MQDHQPINLYTFYTAPKFDQSNLKQGLLSLVAFHQHQKQLILSLLLHTISRLHNIIYNIVLEPRGDPRCAEIHSANHS